MDTVYIELSSEIDMLHLDTPDTDVLMQFDTEYLGMYEPSNEISRAGIDEGTDCFTFMACNGRDKFITEIN